MLNLLNILSIIGSLNKGEEAGLQAHGIPTTRARDSPHFLIINVLGNNDGSQLHQFHRSIVP
jgi:hypothetical protein